MLEVLNFIFSDFWHWLGTLLLITIPLNSVVALIKTMNHTTGGGESE